MNHGKVMNRAELSLGLITKPIGNDSFPTIAKGAHKTEGRTTLKVASSWRYSQSCKTERAKGKIPARAPTAFPRETVRASAAGRSNIRKCAYIDEGESVVALSRNK
jgi:hypothetical protein